MAGLINRLRFLIGKELYYIGYRIQPLPYRRGLSCMSALGIAWAKSHEADLLKVMSGEISIEWECPSPPQEKR